MSFIYILFAAVNTPLMRTIATVLTTYLLIRYRQSTDFRPALNSVSHIENRSIGSPTEAILLPTAGQVLTLTPANKPEAATQWILVDLKSYPMVTPQKQPAKAAK